MPIISDLFDFHKCFFELAACFAQVRFCTEEDQFFEGFNRHQQLAQKLKPELGSLKLLLVKRILEEPHAARFADEIPDIVDNFIALVNSSPHPLAPLDICDPEDSGAKIHFYNRDAEFLDRASLSLNRLDHIMMFCTGEQAPRETAPTNDPAIQPDPQGNETMKRLLCVFTNGVSDDRIKQSDEVLKDESLSVNDKLQAIDNLTPFPSTASAKQLADMLKVSKQAILKSAWWRDHRSGQREEKIEARKARLIERGKIYDN